jgi:hypothetical protein
VALREQGRKLASRLKSTLSDASKREQALKAKVAELKVELGRKTADLRHKSAELKKLAVESVHRAAAIIRGDAEATTEPVAAESAAPLPSPELGSERQPSDKSEIAPSSASGVDAVGDRETDC